MKGVDLYELWPLIAFWMAASTKLLGDSLYGIPLGTFTKIVEIFSRV